MRLTGIQYLSNDYTSNDVNEMAAVMQSTLSSSPSAELRWSKVKESDAQAWLRNTVAASLREAVTMQRMSVAFDFKDKILPQNPSAEHLIIRDLDMTHLGSTSDHEASGRVVAHADWRYTPCFGGQSEGAASDLNEKESYPEGHNPELDRALNQGINNSIAANFDKMPFLYLISISTLTPSHIRKGIAKQFVQWIDPYLEHYSLPVVLYASPLGLHLYRSCGYVEYRDLDVVIDLERWGVKHIHRHVVMIRWPKDESRLPEVWKMWKKNHKEGQTSSS